MTGKIVTEQQVKEYMQLRKNGKTQKIAAAQSGFTERSARSLEKRGCKAAKSSRNWRTRKDPFETVWRTEVVPLLDQGPYLQAQTILAKLQEENPGHYPDSMLRTLQRRVQNWRAKSGPEKELIFRQNHPLGWQGMSDFTHADSLKVSIQGFPFDHMFYHYRLVYSTWESVAVIQGGESFTALAEGLQNALWFSQGTPETHRTDSLSAAYKNCSDKTKEDYTKDYLALCAHYQMQPTRNNKSVAHENGAIESSHGDLKNRVDQALMLRGSRDFSSVEEYRQFITEITLRHNRRIHKHYLEELAHLKALPEHKTTDFSEDRVRVTSGSTIKVREVIYSVPSRLIGTTLKVHIYDDRLECFVGGDLVEKLERKRRSKERIHQINYRHVIGSLRCKPQAFRNYIYRDALFPTLAFRLTWERLDKELDSKTACREYVKILEAAAVGEQESIVNRFLEEQLHQNILPRAEAVRKLFRMAEEHPKLTSASRDLEGYNALLRGVR